VRLLPRAKEPIADLADRRKALYLALRERSVFTQVHYIPVPAQPFYRERAGADGDFAGALCYYGSCLSLPMFPKMTDGDVSRVLEALRQCLSGAQRR
jgi:dTDP-4-amino-4,6-dideoxygalactose transaminase